MKNEKLNQHYFRLFMLKTYDMMFLFIEKQRMLKIWGNISYEMEIQSNNLRCGFKIMSCFSFLSHNFLRNLHSQKKTAFKYKLIERLEPLIFSTIEKE